MVARAVMRFIRISPRKFRQIIPLVKYRPVEEAIEILQNVNKKASTYAIDLLTSALSNAKNNVEGIDTSKLYITKFTADCGPSLKRFRAASMGRASQIIKRTSHITVELDEMKGKHRKTYRKETVKKEKTKDAAVPKAETKTWPKAEAKKKQAQAPAAQGAAKR